MTAHRASSDSKTLDRIDEWGFRSPPPASAKGHSAPTADALKRFCLSRLKPPSNKSGPDKVPTARTTDTPLPWICTRDCPIFKSEQHQEAEGAEHGQSPPNIQEDKWAQPRGKEGERMMERPARLASGQRCSCHFGSNDFNDTPVSVLPPSNWV